MEFILGSLLALYGAANAASAVFYPNANLTDTDGNIIQAHGGAIIQDQNALDTGASTWYWFGQNDSTDMDFDGFLGVSCYRSEDGMSTWENLGLALSPQSGTSISDDAVVERPKVLYNAKTETYVMWFHLDNSDYGLAEVGIATSSSISGPYYFVGGFSPLGQQSRDMGVYQDPDTDDAWLIFATNDNADLAIATLNDDYTNTTEVVYTFSSVYWEAPGVIKNEDTYYLLVSPQNGWTPTANLWLSATSMSVGLCQSFRVT
jgi:Glycosyl hydrolases family 43